MVEKDLQNLYTEKYKLNVNEYLILFVQKNEKAVQQQDKEQVVFFVKIVQIYATTLISLTFLCASGESLIYASERFF